MTPTDQTGTTDATPSTRGRAAGPLGGYSGQVVLVFQGGGALGAYQVGVYQALYEAGIEPDWVIGTSIGAINAAIVAGNPPAVRMDRLDAFWDMIATAAFDPTFGLAGPAVSHQAQAWSIYTRGVRGFFSPNPFVLALPGADLGPARAAYYSTAPLQAALDSLIDVDRLNAPASMRVTLGAVNVTSGEMRYFDRRDGRIDIRHVMASGALPPAFPAVEIDGDLFWDGGIYSNTPVEAVMNDAPRRDSLIFMVNLWHGTGDAPQSIRDVAARAKDIQFSSRADAHIAAEQKLHRLRHVIRELGAQLPETGRTDPACAALLDWGCRSTMHLLRFHAPRVPDEDATKDIDFTPAGIAARRAAGLADARRALAAQAWICDVAPLEGIVLHEV